MEATRSNKNEQEKHVFLTDLDLQKMISNTHTSGTMLKEQMQTYAILGKASWS
jgi:hypothetical protein